VGESLLLAEERQFRGSVLTTWQPFASLVVRFGDYDRSLSLAWRTVKLGDQPYRSPENTFYQECAWPLVALSASLGQFTRRLHILSPLSPARNEIIRLSLAPRNVPRL
jgi:hypothetical protein